MDHMRSCQDRSPLSDSRGTTSGQTEKGPRTIVVDLTPILPGGANGGAKVFCLELMRLLPELAPQAQFILLTAADAHAELATLDRANVRRHPIVSTKPPRSLLQRIIGDTWTDRVTRGLRRLLPAQHTPPLLSQLGADLLFCPFMAPFFAQADVPVLSTFHDLQHKYHPAFFTDEELRQRDQHFDSACRHASMMAAVSEYARRTALQHGYPDPRRIVTVPLRMARRDPGSSEADSDILDQLGLQPGSYLLYPANFWPHKNHEMLLAALGIAHARLAPDIRLVCTGAPGARRDELIAMAADMGLAERIVFPGYVSTAALQTLLQQACAMIFPSLHEGFGIPVVEAMAAGIPVACSRSTSLPEVAGEAALTFDPHKPLEIAEAIVALTQDQALRQRLSQAGRAQAAPYLDARQMAAEYWALMQRTCAMSDSDGRASHLPWTDA